MQQQRARAWAALLAAEAAGDPAERFRLAHLGALRAAASLLEGRRTAARRGPRSAWELVERERPELRPWTAYFASGARLRAAVEAGRDVDISAEQAEHVLSMAHLFLEVVGELPMARAS